MSTTEIPVDVDVLRREIRETYTEVSTKQEKEFIFPTGRAWAQELGYPEPELSRVPDARGIGVDMTVAMLEQTRASATRMGLTNVAVHEALIEASPIGDASVDVV